MNKKDIVYPLGNGSEWDDNEIRYSLRSIEMYLKNYGRIFIIGCFPDFLKESENLIHIPFEDVQGKPSTNIRNKILAACNDERVSDDFAVMNDDYYFTQLVDISNYPYYYDNTLENAISRTVGNWYREYLVNTEALLFNPGVMRPLNFDVHTPIVYNKQYFELMCEKIEDKEQVVIRSIYCSMYNTGGFNINDTKLRGSPPPNDVDRKIKNFHVFSTGDWCLRGDSYVKKVITEMFPNKSSFEK
jgi:hypothetical protein